MDETYAEHLMISEVKCEYWQVLGFIVCIGMYVGLYCGTYHLVLLCIDMVCIMACIGMYYFWYVIHILVSIGMYSEVICASIHMYWLVLACMEKLFVLY